MNDKRTLPLVIEPSDLEACLGQKGPLIIDLCNPQIYQQFHIPGAISVSPKQLITGTQPATGKLPSLDQLEELFSQLGYTGKEHFVVYDDEGGGWAGRFIWTLDVIGHKYYSYLNGGLHAWIKERRQVESTPNHATPTKVSLDIDRSVIASKDYIIEHLNDPAIKIWDARSPEEFLGGKVLAKRGGHIPGAINFEWTRAMNPEKHFRIREGIEAELAELGLDKDKEIITHCQTHHRSGFTYLVAKVLGYRTVRAYDGSWSEWGNLKDTPIE